MQYKAKKLYVKALLESNAVVDVILPYEAAQEFNKTPKTIYNWITAGKVDVVDAGQLYIVRDSILKHLEKKFKNAA